jgi:hypothetical protein
MVRGNFPQTIFQTMPSMQPTAHFDPRPAFEPSGSVAVVALLA